MKLLILFPNSTNTATISTAVPILCGIAKHMNWAVDYFDTHKYKKKENEDKKDTTGGFKFSIKTNKKFKEFNDIVVDLQNKINEYKPNLLAITALSPEYDFLLSFFPKINIPDYCKVVIGGIHATLKPEETINTQLFDLVVLGEGEETFSDILKIINNKKDIKNISGTYYFDRSKKIINKNSKRYLLPIDLLWSIERDYSFFNEEYFIRPYDGKKIRRNEIEISRGCPYHCKYCGNRALKKFNNGLGKYVKTRPIESSISEMKMLIENFNINIFSFTDECFLSHPIQWLKNFMDLYKKYIGKPYFLMTRPETITEEKIKLLLSYDIPFQTSIGVESGSSEILLNVCDRTCTPEKVLKAFKILNKHKIRTNTFFMVGLPFEKREDVFKSIKVCKKIKPSVSSVSIFQPYPGQELTQECIDNKFFDGKKIPGNFTSDSLLNMPKPYLSKIEIKNLWRVFMLYALLPKKYYKQIEKCENAYENNKELYNKLIKIRWEKYDWSEIKNDIKLM